MCSDDIQLDLIKCKWCMSLDPNDALIDPIKSNWCMSLDLLMCAICVCIQSWESYCVKVVQLVMCEVAIVLQINPSNCIGFFL